MKVEYKELTLEDLEDVARIYNELMYFIQEKTKDEYWDFTELTVEKTSNRLKDYIDNPEQTIYIAKDHEEVIGFIAGEIINCHLPISNVKKVGYISAAYVVPKYRGKGVMKSLDMVITNFFKDCGLKYVELSFISKNQLARDSWTGIGYTTFREQARKRIYE